MKVTTNINKSDLIRFNLAILPKLRSTYMSILVIALFVFGFLCWKNGFPQCQNNWIAILLGSVGGGFFGMLSGVIYSTISILLMSPQNNGIFGEHEYTLTPEGLHERTSENEGLNRWSGIIKVKVVGSFLLFQISGYLFHIVPVRSFDSQDSFNEFLSSSMKYWKNSHKNRDN